MKFGAAAAAGLSMGIIPTGCAENARSDDADVFSPLKYSFLIDPDSFSRINSETKIVESVSPLSVYGGVNGFTELHKPMMLDAYSLEKASQAKEMSACSDSEKILASPVVSDLSSTFLNSVLIAQVGGFAEMTDVSADSIGSLLQYGKIDLGMEFLHADPQTLWLGKQVISPENTIVSVDIMKQLGKRIDLDLFGWKFQVRGPETHSLGSCVGSKVTHINFEIQRSMGNGRYAYVANFHLGVYKDGRKRCFVLWNNENPYKICWKSCSANNKTLTEMMKWVVAAVAAALAIYLSAFIIAAIAEALAVALLPVLAVLAI